MAHFPYKTAMQLSLLCASCTLFAAQPLTNEAKFLKRMKEYWKEGDFDTAKRQIRAYLEQNQGSSLQEEMHLLLGDLYLKEGNFNSALEEYDFLQKPELCEKTFYNKVLCYYELGRMEDLIQVANSFSSQTKLTVDQKNSIRYLCASNFFENFISQQEKNPILLEKAKDLFESCAGTSFENLSIYPLARIYEISGNKKSAASYYEVAAKLHPDMSIQLLFQSAILRSDIAPDLAISTFEQLFSTPNPKQAESLYNSLLLQYKTKKFKDFVSSYEKNRHLLSNGYERTALEYLGKSLYHLGSYEDAIDPLLETLQTSKDLSVQKTTQLMLLECAYKIQNVDLYRKMFRNPAYPLVNDENYNKAHLVYLNLLKSREYFPEFVEESKMFVSLNPNHPETESVLWDACYFLYQEKKWKESSSMLISFLDKFPSSKLSSNAWRLQLNSRLFALQTCSSQEISSHRQDLINTIKACIDQPSVLTSSEKETFSFELIKNLFLEEQFEEALSAIQALSENSSQNRFSNEVQLLKTLCYLSNPNHQALFIANAEKLLETNHEFADADKLRLHLFNAYVQEGNASADQKETSWKKAAEHLYVLFQKGTSSIKSENIQWLAEHYFELAQKSKEDPLFSQETQRSYIAKSSHVFESLLPSEKKELNEQAEAALLRLSTLLSWSGQMEKRATLLENLLTPSVPTQSPIQRQLLLDLAQTHQAMGNSIKALNIYNMLIENHPASSVRALAILDRSRLLRAYLPKEQQTEENAVYAQNLLDLKDLEIQRSLQSEPLHLEAGLEYITCKAALTEDRQSHIKKKIQLLRLFKENFESEFLEQESSTPSVKEKEMLVLSYLQFAEAEILRLEALVIDTPSDAKSLTAAAEGKIKDLLLQGSLPESLKKRVEISQQELGNSL